MTLGIPEFSLREQYNWAMKQQARYNKTGKPPREAVESCWDVYFNMIENRLELYDNPLSLPPNNSKRSTGKA